MNFEPIIKAKLNSFRQAYNLISEQDGVVFERFANQTILTNHQPSAFSVEDNLLDTVCVGGFNDMGIDGLCIKINGILINSLSDVEDIISIHKKIDIEFIFIQSKYKDKFDSGEYGKFTNGIIDFLAEKQYQPSNSKINHWIKIKEFLNNDDIIMLWNNNPTIRLYYVVMGQWNDSPHINALTQRFKEQIASLNTYGDVIVKYIDINSFKRICDDNENLYSCVINYYDSMSLTEVDNVGNSIIVLCSAEELITMLTTEDGIIRKGLFDDNVRDYQGDTVINNEILKTITDEPKSFILLNNGITIVCNDIILGNRRVIIKNPQIVNGCQTSSVLFSASKEKIDISNISISVKIIATQSDEITNKIVKGTNRQNIVYDEAFEITREFHKQLEELFNVLSSDCQSNKIFYERRSKQYFNNPSIRPSQKVNLRIIIQSFISIFLNEPHQGHRHESKLIQEYKNKIFNDSQSKLPYYTAALIYNKFDNWIRNNTSNNSKEIRTYKAHLCLIIKLLAGGESPSINNEKEIDKYCNMLLGLITDNKKFEELITRSTDILENTQKLWIKSKGESYRFGIKDSPDFTTFLLKQMSIKIEENSAKTSNRGKVVKISYDRFGLKYGFISRSPDDIFFHSSQNMQIDFSEILNKDVLYEVIEDARGRENAVKIQVI